LINKVWSPLSLPHGDHNLSESTKPSKAFFNLHTSLCNYFFFKNYLLTLQYLVQFVLARIYCPAPTLVPLLKTPLFSISRLCNKFCPPSEKALPFFNSRSYSLICFMSDKLSFTKGRLVCNHFFMFVDTFFQSTHSNFHAIQIWQIKLILGTENWKENEKIFIEYDEKDKKYESNFSSKPFIKDFSFHKELMLNLQKEYPPPFPLHLSI